MGQPYAISCRPPCSPGIPQFKVADVRIVGLWLTRFLRSEFERYVSKRGGNLRALLAAQARQ